MVFLNRSAAVLMCIAQVFLLGCHNQNGKEEPTLFGINVNGKRGFIDQKGLVVIAPQFDSADEFSEGLAAVCVGRCDYIDTNEEGSSRSDDEVHLTPQQAKAIRGNMREHGLLTKQFAGKWGYVDPHGKLVVTPQFSVALKFSHGLASVALGAAIISLREQKSTLRYGYADRQGKLVIPAQFTSADAFGDDGPAKACIGDGADERCGFINTGGQFVINPRSWIVFPFENGVAWFREKPEPDTTLEGDKVFRAGYIDTKGQVVWQTSEWKVEH
jgi:hypothetical protein